MARYCIRCGTKNPDNAGICGGCGMPFEEGASQDSFIGVYPIKDEDERASMVQPPVRNNAKPDFSVKKLIRTNPLVDAQKVREITCGKEFMFVLAEEVGISSTEYKVQNSIHSAGLLRCKKIRYNGRITLFYCTEDYKSLEILFPSLDENRFLLILENVISKVTEIRENGFLADTGLDLRISKIYVDSFDGNVYLTYLPVSERCYPDEWYLEEQLRKDLSYLLRSVSASQSFTITNLVQMLEEPACSFGSILSAIRQNRSMSTGNG